MTPARCSVSAATGGQLPRFPLNTGRSSRVLSDHAFSSRRLAAWTALIKQTSFSDSRFVVANKLTNGLHPTVLRESIRKQDRSNLRCLAKRRTSKAVDVDETQNKPQQLASGHLCVLCPQRQRSALSCCVRWKQLQSLCNTIIS